VRTISFARAAAPQVRTVEVARTFFERSRGLLGRTGLAPDHGLLIERCNAIHTLFMKFPIDAVFLDRNGKPVRTVKNIRPGRVCVWGGWRAKSTLELAAGTAADGVTPR